jgi:hypothetical protein
VHEVPPGSPEQVRRLERYRQEHPDVDIQPPGAGSAVWRAFRDGDLIAYGFTLMVFLERLEVLPEPLGAAQDFALHLPASHSLVRLPGVPRARGMTGDGHAEPLGSTHSRRAVTRADGPGRRHLPAPPMGNPVGNPVQAGDARGWY